MDTPTPPPAQPLIPTQGSLSRGLLALFVSSDVVKRSQAPSKRPASRALLGISLVELLVVLGIIVILAGILVPFVSGAISKSRTAKSVSNLGQIYRTISSYVSDNNGNFPYSFGTSGALPPGATDREYWYNVVKVRLYPHPTAAGRSALDGPTGWGGVADTDVTLTILWSPNAEKTWRKGVATYGYNDLFSYNPNRSQKLPLFFNNTRTVLLADNMNASGNGTQSLNPSWAKLNARNGASRDLATNGVAIAVFLDGHTELLPKERCAELNSSSSDTFWTGKP